MLKIWNAFVGWWRAMFAGPSIPEGTIERPGSVAAEMRSRASTRVANSGVGAIVCPWCNKTNAETCSFSHQRNYFDCSACARHGSIKTLLSRLQTPDAYRRAIL